MLSLKLINWIVTNQTNKQLNVQTKTQGTLIGKKKNIVPTESRDKGRVTLNWINIMSFHCLSFVWYPSIICRLQSMHLDSAHMEFSTEVLTILLFEFSWTKLKMSNENFWMLLWFKFTAQLVIWMLIVISLIVGKLCNRIPSDENKTWNKTVRWWTKCHMYKEQIMLETYHRLLLLRGWRKLSLWQ